MVKSICMFSLRHAIKFTSANRVDTTALAGRVVIQGDTQVKNHSSPFNIGFWVLLGSAPYNWTTHTENLSRRFSQVHMGFLTLRWVTVHDVCVLDYLLCVIFTSPALPACTSSRQLDLLTVDIPYRRRGRNGGSGTLTCVSSLTLHPAVCDSALIAHGPRKELENSGWVRRWGGAISHGVVIYTELTSSSVTVSPCRLLTAHSLSVGESNTLIDSSRVN